ncbi:hypothetical protein HYX58_01630 [Candidatus Dependentiae bacterium]|nr:hypothetical protein [Candidatus Dependentiae bacterium]
MMQEAQGIKLYDLYGWWYKPFWHQPAFYIPFGFVICALVLAMLIFLVRYIKRSRKKVLDPWQEALNNLQKINLGLFEDQDTHKLFYGHLTRVLKTYLAKRYDLSLEGKTDQEVIEAVKHSALPADLQEQVRHLFSGAEIIKFAHQEGAGERMRYDLIRAIDIVRNTIPNPHLKKKVGGEILRGGKNSAKNEKTNLADSSDTQLR